MEQGNGLAAAIQGGMQEMVDKGEAQLPQNITPVSLQQNFVETHQGPTTETVPAPAAEPEKPVTTEQQSNNNEVLSNTEPPKVTPETTSPGANGEVKPDLTQDLNRMLEEKSSGKVKSFDDLKAILDKPEPKLEFAHDAVSKLNEYVSQGRTPEERQRLFEDYQATQTTDFNSLSAVDQIAFHRQLEDPDLTDDLLQLEMNLEYRFDEWKDKPEDYEGGVEPREITLAKMKFERDANKALKNNIAYQEKWKTPRTEKSQESIVAEQKAAKENQDKWFSNVDKTASELGKMTIKMSDTENVDYVIPAETQKKVAEIAKSLWTDPNAAFKSFVDEKSGTIDAKGLLTMIIKAETFDSAMKVVAQQARGKGAEQVAKDIKNISMTPDGKPGAMPEPSSKEQAGAQIEKGLLRI